MKNIVIVILVVLLVALGLYVAKKEGITSVKELATSVEKAVDDTVNTVKSKVDTKLQLSSDKIPPAMVNLPADTALSISLPAKAIEPAITHINDFIVKVKTSSLGKKLEIDKMIDQGLQAAEAGAGADPFSQDPDFGSGMDENGMPNSDLPNSAASGMTSSKQPSLEEILKTIQNFEKFDFILRAKTLEGKSTPLLKVNASFKDDAYSKQLQTLLEGFVEMSKQGAGEGPQLKKDEQDPLTYVLNVKPPFSPVEVLARVKTAGKDISATVGVIAGPSTPPATALKEGTDSVISQAALSKDAFATYLNINNFRTLVDVVAGLIPGEQTKEQSEAVRKALDSSLGAYSAFAINSIFENGFKGNTCARFSPNGSVFTPFKAAIDSSNSYKSSFYKLIGPRTTLALRMDGAYAGASIQNLFSTVNNPAISNTALSSDPEVAAATSQMLAQYKVAEEEVKKLKITDVGLVANAPTSSFVPDVGVYLEHASGVTIEQFGASLQILFKKLAPPSLAGNSPITISKDSAGQTQVVIPAMEGYELTFKAISDTQFFGSIQDSFTDEAKILLTAKEPFVDDAKLASKGVSAKISDNDNFYYLSSSSVMPLLRQFAPFITMSKPELKINDTELNQFLELFDFNVLATAKNSSPEDLVLCTNGAAAVY